MLEVNIVFQSTPYICFKTIVLNFKRLRKFHIEGLNVTKIDIQRCLILLYHIANLSMGVKNLVSSNRKSKRQDDAPPGEWFLKD
jgi:hypothetical protein